MITEHTNKPLSFIEWKTHYEDSFEATELPKLYNSYLDDWKTKKLDKLFYCLQLYYYKSL